MIGYFKSKTDESASPRSRSRLSYQQQRRPSLHITSSHPIISSPEELNSTKPAHSSNSSSSSPKFISSNKFLMPSSFTTPTSRWAALQARDPSATNAFIYSVITTKIYCRPTCPSRLARRANIVFHSSASEAAAAGFRPCKRCRPDVVENDGDAQKIAVRKACEILRSEVGRGEGRFGDGGKVGVKELAKKVGLTEFHFCRVFKKVMGVTVGMYRRGIELELELQRSGGASDTQQHDTPSAEENLVTQDGFDVRPNLVAFTDTDVGYLGDLIIEMTRVGEIDRDEYGADMDMGARDGSLAFEPCYRDARDDLFRFIDFGSQSAV